MRLQGKVMFATGGSHGIGRGSPSGSPVRARTWRSTTGTTKLEQTRRLPREVTPRFAMRLAVLGARDRKSASRFRHSYCVRRVISVPRFTAEELERLRALAAEWGKIVSKRAFGEAGPGLDVDFRTMEQIATAAAQGLTEGAL